jgi:hypothetical protein
MNPQLPAVLQVLQRVGGATRDELYKAAVARRRYHEVLALGFSFRLFLERGLDYLHQVSARLRKLEEKPIIHFPEGDDFLILPQDCYPGLQSNQNGMLTMFLESQGYIFVGKERENGEVIKCDERRYVYIYSKEARFRSHHVLTHFSKHHRYYIGNEGHENYSFDSTDGYIVLPSRCKYASIYVYPRLDKKNEDQRKMTLDQRVYASLK